MKKLLLLPLLTSLLFGDTIHSSISTYLETKDYDSSLQKKDAIVYGVGADVHYKNSAYKVTYEYGRANTKQPPMTKDLNNQKLFLRYAYKINNDFEINLNYINILHDNIAITDDGKIYGAGFTYKLKKNISANLTQYYSDYDDFDVYQSDLKIDFKAKINGIKTRLSSTTKYINIDEENVTGFTKNAKREYLTTGLKLHAHYKTYHFGTGIYFGKRAFAIMNDGAKVQHHAMEFDRTFAIGAGKSIGNFVLRFQYIYQRATELPTKNSGVDINTMRFIANYKF